MNPAPPGYTHAESPEHVESSHRQNENQDRKAAYALTLQNACKTAFQRVKNNNVVANSNWASPLAAAPSAVSTMAILLKTAEMKNAAGLEIESQKVKDQEGAVRGTLPSKYFHTNLQHCSDVGRLAFLEAQHGMNNIRATARGMIAEDGSIGYIIDLLEDPEDAKYNLKPEIDAIKASAKKCLDNAKAIASKFEYWHLVICHLRQTSLSKRGIEELTPVTTLGETIKEKEDTDQKKTDAEADQVKYAEDKKTLEARIEFLQTKLKTAELNVDRAQTEMDRLRYEPITPEPSIWEEVQNARRMIPSYQAPKRERGLFTGMKDALGGQSSKHYAEDVAALKEHEAHVLHLENQAMASAKEQREYQRRLAANRFNEARENEKKVMEELDTARNELSASSYQLGEAKANLMKTKWELKRLSNKELEIAAIMEILDESTQNLGKLKEQIEPLVDFFKTILSDIHNNVEENLEAFLRPITHGITESSDPEQVKTLRISRRSKERILATALQMQGRFSAMTDISTAYITISSNYIRPAINKMEGLSTVSESEWSIRSTEFFQWCENAMTEIDEVARKTNTNVQRNMENHINALQRRAIEAADAQDEGI